MVLEQLIDDGDRAYASGQYEDAVAAFRRISREFPDADIRLRLGEALVSAGNHQEGLQLLRSRIRDRPSTGAFVIYAWSLDHIGDRSSAIEAAQMAVQCDDGFSEAHTMLGSLLVDTERENAVWHFRRALALDPEDYYAMERLGMLLGGADETAGEAVTLLNSVVDKYPENEDALAYLANALWRTGAIRDAHDAYQRLLQRDPNEPMYHRWLADFEAATGFRG